MSSVEQAACPGRSGRGAGRSGPGQGPTVFDWLVDIFEDQIRGRLLLR